MVQDKERMDFVEFWAKKCRKNMKKCLSETGPFIDSQIKTANEFYKRLTKTPNGRKKIRELKNIA
jgi:DNA-binding MarR family transcriptional regulator